MEAMEAIVDLLPLGLAMKAIIIKVLAKTKRRTTKTSLVITDSTPIQAQLFQSIRRMWIRRRVERFGMPLNKKSNKNPQLI